MSFILLSHLDTHDHIQHPAIYYIFTHTCTYHTMNKNQNESEFSSYFPAILSFLVTEELKEDLALNLFKEIFLLLFILQQLKRASMFSIFKS